MKLTFIYKGSVKPPSHYEKFTEKVVTIVKSVYVLPDKIEIQFEEMGPSVYGMTMLDPRFPNRIRLNQDLSLEEYLLPLTHELLHLHQMYTNRLSSQPGGRILWDKVPYKVNMLDMSYNDYQQLPWEQDVSDKQTQLLKLLEQNRKKIRVAITP
jgi:hypothetical protein